MSVGDEYRVKAAELNARARTERDLAIRAQYENLALSYLRLAEQAEKNAWKRTPEGCVRIGGNHFPLVPLFVDVK